MAFLITILLCACFFGLLWWLTSDPDLRHCRWKVPVSMPLLFLVIFPIVRRGLDLGSGMLAFILVLVLGLLWTQEISWLLSGSLMKFLHGEPTTVTGFRPDYVYAKSHFKDGNWEESLRLTQVELEKDSKNFEGLMLSATIYQKLQLPANAIVQLKIILNNSDASDDQKAVATVEKEKCERLQRELAAMPPLKPLAKK
jgi:hypothetical protein